MTRPVSTDIENAAADEAASVDTPFGQLAFAKQIIRGYGSALQDVARRLDAAFCEACGLVYGRRGSVIVSGMGKAGLIGQKIAATLASTGAPSHFLHPAEAMHGDLGRIGPDDVVLMFSQSGETEEVVRLLPSLARMLAPLIAVTCRKDSTLARAANVTLDLGPLKEACSLGLAPSTSTVAMLAVGDALALVVSRMKKFEPADFARFHPGGSLGFQLSHARDHLRPLNECRVASATHTVREVLVLQSRPGRRTGAIMLVNDAGKLAGVFTDSDLARLFETRRDGALDGPIGDVMTARPMTVAPDTMMTEVVGILADKKISELPVVDRDGRPVGLLDITDIVAMLPEEPRVLARPA